MKKIILLCLAISVATSCTDEFGSASYLDSSDFIATGNRFNEIEENPFVNVADQPVSTFSVDADGASFGIVRRFLSTGTAPVKGAIRVEELINYFPLDYENALFDHPISLNGEVSMCPWEATHKLVRIGIKGNDIPSNELPPSNIVLLVDVSGSMGSVDKLGLAKKAFQMMAEKFKSDDRIAIVTYAGNAGVALESTRGDEKLKIARAIAELSSNGSTNGAQGIITAYEIAKENFIEGGNNRVILVTDGDFNVGVSSSEELISLIEQKRDDGVFLTVVGVGFDNLNDAMMEQLANHGNGTYEYLDSEEEAKKIFVNEYHKFYPAAKDVKVQVSFNPSLVSAYRLIGYENRLLNDEDFEDDKKDAGEISVGQNITALYEIVPATSAAEFRAEPTFTIDFRYKRPNEDESLPMMLEIVDGEKSFLASSESMRFVASVAAFGMILRDSPYKGSASFQDVKGWVSNASTYDPYGYRVGFKKMIEQAAAID